MHTDSVDKTFDPQTLAEDINEVGRIYAQFFDGLTEEDWDKPVKGGGGLFYGADYVNPAGKENQGKNAESYDDPFLHYSFM